MSKHRKASASAIVAELFQRNPDLAAENPRLHPAARTPLVACSHYSMPAPVPTEHEEQVALFQWAEANEAQYPSLAMLAAIPNGGYRPMTTAAMLKAEGVKAGYPDILLDVARGPYHGLRIELKRADRSNHATDAQRDWLAKLAFEGYQVAVCYGAAEAIKVITDYLTKI